MTISEKFYVALDQGGHASRALVFDSRGYIVAQHDELIATLHDNEHIEHDPDEVAASVATSLDRVVRQLGTQVHRVAAAGLATQRSSIVCWDKQTGRALSPIISWQDRRAAAWLTTLATEEKRIRDITGLVLSPHYGASKLRWCLDHNDEVKKAARANRLAIGPLASFLIFRLCREQPLLADPANASRTLLWNPHTLDWDLTLLAMFGIPLSLLPRSVPSRYTFGTLDVAGHALPLTLVMGDQSAALFAYGAVNSETAYVNVGTGAFVQRVFYDRPLPCNRLLMSTVFTDQNHTTFALEGTINGAASALEWFSRQHAIDNIEHQLGTWLAQTEHPPLFLNGISGLGSPFWCSQFATQFIGQGTHADQAVAVAESILFLIKANLDIIENCLGSFDYVMMNGGLAQLQGLAQRLADLTGKAVARPDQIEATARGLAYLLANCPAQWNEGGAADILKPNRNLPLSSRYQQWLNEMNKAIESNGLAVASQANRG